MIFHLFSISGVVSSHLNWKQKFKIFFKNELLQFQNGQMTQTFSPRRCRNDQSAHEKIITIKRHQRHGNPNCNEISLCDNSDNHSREESVVNDFRKLECCALLDSMKDVASGSV